MWIAVFGMFRGFVPRALTIAALPPIVFARAALFVVLGVSALRSTEVPGVVEVPA